MAAAARALLLPVFGVVAAPLYDLICMLQCSGSLLVLKKFVEMEKGK